MKKNISINLQGIIFHIEEDGYEQLSVYLASIRSYFSGYEGHEEIIADIEARIAEIFANHLSPGKQVITQEDVQKLISQMGSVSDFEQEEPVLEEAAYASASSAAHGSGSAYGAGYSTATEEALGNDGTGYQEPQMDTHQEPKRLYRDFSNRIISGVAAGLANYLAIDPLWIRLLLVLLLVLAPFTAGISIAFVLAGYIIFWIAMPVNYHLPESSVKKLFRDPFDRQLGGVASGIAKYFGLDVTVVRVLFLASALLGGTGLLLYIGFWIAVPEAVTLTERMQMQGDPVTLSGIEQTLKENLRFKDQNGEETAAAKVLMLPLRLLSQLITWLGKTLGPLFAAIISLIRVIAGIILLVVSLGLSLALFGCLLVATGAINETSGLWTSNIPFSVFLNGFPDWGLLAGFVVGFIPVLLLFILAISLLAGRFFLRPIAGWSMFAVWIVSIFALITSLALFNQNFSRYGEVELTQQIPVEAYQTLTFDAYETQRSYGYIDVDVQGHGGSNLEVRQQVEAKGRTEDEAKQNARMVAYRLVQRDSVLRFDDSYTFKEGASFRKQHLNLSLLVPEGKKLRFTSSFADLLPATAFEENYSHSEIVRNVWQARGEKLTCLTCATDTLVTEATTAAFSQPETVPADLAAQSFADENDEETQLKQYNFSDFTRISANGPYHLRLVQGDAFRVTAQGSKEAIGKLRISKSGSELRIEPQRRFLTMFSQQEPLLIQVTMPNLRVLELSGAIQAEADGIKTDKFNLLLAGAIKSKINVEAKTVKVEMTGVSQNTMTGHADKLTVEMAGAGTFDAANLQAKSVSGELMGACNAVVFATNTLRADATGASTFRYKGNPANVTTDVVGASKVVRLDN